MCNKCGGDEKAKKAYVHPVKGKAVFVKPCECKKDKNPKNFSEKR